MDLLWGCRGVKHQIVPCTKVGVKWEEDGVEFENTGVQWEEDGVKREDSGETVGFEGAAIGQRPVGESFEVIVLGTADYAPFPLHLFCVIW